MRQQTVSVAPPEPRQVPEGDKKKIKAMSWLLDHPDTKAEAAVQVRSAAVLVQYALHLVTGFCVFWQCSAPPLPRLITTRQEQKCCTYLPIANNMLTSSPLPVSCLSYLT